jgi:hypothetical protein
MDHQEDTMRTLIAESHGGQYTYWLDDTSPYIHQRRGMEGEWVGYLCSLDAWERTFSVTATFGPFASYAEAFDKWGLLHAHGWRLQPMWAPQIDQRGMGTGWEFVATAPNMKALDAEAMECVRLYTPAG